ncbi:MAG: T9SS type A sorting domain-containing protein [Paludibacteraceae bacterium]|nr:T9SS type A sorting domain-containing protein [Paludibacteraceae bacterium]
MKTITNVLGSFILMATLLCPTKVLAQTYDQPADMELIAEEEYSVDMEEGDIEEIEEEETDEENFTEEAEEPIETSALRVGNSMLEKNGHPYIYNDGDMLYVGNCVEDAIFEVYDLAGKVVAHATTAPIEISNLKRGVYVLDINGKGYKFFLQ